MQGSPDFSVFSIQEILLGQKDGEQGFHRASLPADVWQVHKKEECESGPPKGHGGRLVKNLSLSQAPEMR